MNNTAIKVDKVSKNFKLPHERHGSVKNVFVNAFKRKKTYEKQEVLKDISFEINKGDFFGIVGRNGSGKSTLLKTIAGIYHPDNGVINVDGKIVPFIELGVGFNPELTGRENVYLNGALLGFSRSEMKKLYGDIVEFAELEKFMDQKLKNYSSGMQVRLAFSIAIRAKSDILILDEVLAVGDASFQRKCNDYFTRIKLEKKTVVLVTHDMNAVERFCNKALFLADGKIKSIGSPQEVAYRYTIENLSDYSSSELRGQRKKQKNQKGPVVKIMDTQEKEAHLFSRNDELTVDIRWDNPDIRNIGVALLTSDGEYVFGTNTDIDKFEVSGQKLQYKLNLNLGDGKYMFKIGLYGENDQDKIDFIDDGPSFSIVTHNKERWGGIVPLKHEWKNG